MPFASDRPVRELLRRVTFGELWLSLRDPSDDGACDPASVLGRMALYRLLVERCGEPGAFGAGDALSPFWGYASQLAWQQRSGRLARPEGGGTPPGDRIDSTSWWGACNYALCVVPYVAGIQLGAVPPLRFPPDHADGEISRYPDALSRWRDAIRRMQKLRPGGDTDSLRLMIWAAHLASTRTATRIHGSKLRAMSGAEQRFAQGWVRMVDLFAAAGLRTDLAYLAERGSGALPSRQLRASDADGAFADLPRAEQSAARRVIALGDRPWWRWSVDRSIWRRIMRTRAAREDAQAILSGMFGRGRTAWRSRALGFAYAALPTTLANRLPTVRAILRWP